MGITTTIMMAYNKEQCQRAMLTATSKNYENDDRDAFDNESNDRDTRAAM